MKHKLITTVMVVSFVILLYALLKGLFWTTNIALGVCLLAIYADKRLKGKKVNALATPADKKSTPDSASDVWGPVSFVPVTEEPFSCGHDLPRTDYVLNIMGKEVPVGKDAPVCPDCVQIYFKDAIRCAGCGEVINVGAGVAMYMTSSPPVFASVGTQVEQPGTGMQYIYCMRMNCCPTGAAYVGAWNGKGITWAHGGMSLAAQVFTSGTPMIM